MSAIWGITYFELNLAPKDIFNAIVEAFQSELAGKIYTLGRSRDGKTVEVLLKKTVIEWFTDPQRAEMIEDAYDDIYREGVLLYPPRNNLYVLRNQLLGISVLASGRSTRESLKSQMEFGLMEKPHPYDETLLYYMNFLKYLTKRLQCQAVHVLYDRSPAGHSTSVHFYESGEFFADYHYTNVEAIGTETVEIVSRPVEKFLGGRFAFLNRQPFMTQTSEFAHYFQGEDLPSSRTSEDYDDFNLRHSGLFVPFWEDMTPLGAVYCYNDPLPAHLTNQRVDPEPNGDRD